MAPTGAIKKKNADKLVVDKESPGKFLIRDAKKDAGGYVLTVEYKGNSTHHAIKQDGDVLSLNTQLTECKTVKELLHYLREKRKTLKWPIAIDPANGVVNKQLEKQQKKAEQAQKAKKEKKAAKKDKKDKASKMKKGAAAKEVADEPVVVESEDDEPADGKENTLEQTEAVAAALPQAAEQSNGVAEALVRDP